MTCGHGQTYEEYRKVTGGIFRTDGSGAPWRDLPERYGSWWATYDCFRRWIEDGTLQSVARKL